MATKSSITGTPIVVDTASIARLSKDIRAVSPAAWEGAKLGLRAAGNVLMPGIRARASFSERIPGSVKLRTTAAGNIKIQAGGDAAPNAAPIENRGKGYVRHPTFSPRENVNERVGWTDLNSRPAFMAPELEANASMIASMVLDTIETAITKALGA